jgi:hypothetical protein
VKNVAIALVLILSAASGYSQCTAKPVDARKEMRTSSAVIVGTVTDAKPVAESWDFFDGVSYTVHVDSTIHGKAPHGSEIELFSENSPNFFPMSVGKHYVLYVQAQFDRYEVNNCGNSHQTDETAVLNSQLEKGY